MSFARRAPEFLPSCGVSLLLDRTYRPALENLVRLSLYDCGLRSLAGIEELDNGSDARTLFPSLEQLDIGRNTSLINESIPSTFHTQLPSLLELWCDDCSFGPAVPMPFLKMDHLQVVRLTSNKLEGILEEEIGNKYWNEVRVLALDGNLLSDVGKGLGGLRFLEKLHLR